jgi:dTDP-4-dehydrorhamnose 3,5-epimerase
MKITETNIKDVFLITPKVFKDDRGDFRETYEKERYKAIGIDCDFIQDNLVFSKKNVFRGLHLQSAPYEQAKLITVIRGTILDIALDLRKNSPSYLQQVQIELHEHDQLFIPTGFAHAYYVLSDQAIISYKVSSPYAPDHQTGILWNDPSLGLKSIIKDPIISKKDANLLTLNEIINII